MANYGKKISDTNVRIGEVRFFYVNVFAPRTNPDGDSSKYGVCVAWPKTDAQTTKLVTEAVEAAKQNGKTKKWGGKIPANVKSPVRDGDIDREDDENFAGCWFINCNCGQKPGVRVLENGMIVEALDESDFYSGCYGAATINFFPYDFNGNRGVGAGLNNVIKTKDGDRMSGGASAESDFGDLVADLSFLK